MQYPITSTNNHTGDLIPKIQNTVFVPSTNIQDIRAASRQRHADPEESGVI